MRDFSLPGIAAQGNVPFHFFKSKNLPDGIMKRKPFIFFLRFSVKLPLEQFESFSFWLYDCLQLKKLVFNLAQFNLITACFWHYTQRMKRRVTDAALQEEALLHQLSASVLLAARVILRRGYSVIILLGIIFWLPTCSQFPKVKCPISCHHGKTRLILLVHVSPESGKF